MGKGTVLVGRQRAGGGARWQGGMIESGRGWDVHVHVLLDSDMNPRGSTLGDPRVRVTPGEKVVEKWSGNHV